MLRQKRSIIRLVPACPEPSARASNCLSQQERAILSKRATKREKREKTDDNGVVPVVDRNIRAFYARRRREARAAGLQTRIADAITRFTGSMVFVYLHLVVFSFWIVANLGWIPGVSPWDRAFTILAMAASVEAIFLSTFVLITQNRMSEAADKRADLDLQVSLLAEHELTKLTVLVSDIAKKLDVETTVEHDIEQVKTEVVPDVVLDRIEAED
jgi:uncharacterized membrane protein